MQIEVVKIGKPAFASYAPLVQEYLKRMSPFARMTNSVLKESEAEKRFGPRASATKTHLILLDERAKGLTSQALATKVQGWFDDPGIGDVTIVVGPPYGFPTEWQLCPNDTLALSQLTLTSDMAWLLIWEQLYRAFQIIQGTGYHHD